MKQISRYLLLLCCLSTMAQAQSTSFYCAKNAAYVRLGDSQESVKQACGHPTQITQRALPANSMESPSQLWIYTANQLNTHLNNARLTNRTNNDPVLFFEISNKKVARILYKNTAMPSINICQGKTLIQQDTPEQLVLSICGTPSQVKTLPLKTPANTSDNQAVQNQVIWTYSDDYGSSTTFVFTENKLTSIE